MRQRIDGALLASNMRSPMPRAAASPTFFSVVFGALRTGFAAFAALIVVFAVALAAVAAAVVGLLIAAAAMVLRVRPRRDSVGEVLEGRRTADGWVVEAHAR
jgi:hypothetical protein